MEAYFAPAFTKLLTIIVFAGVPYQERDRIVSIKLLEVKAPTKEVSIVGRGPIKGSLRIEILKKERTN